MGKRNVAIIASVAIFSFALGVLVPLSANIGAERRTPPAPKRYGGAWSGETLELLDIVKIWKATKELKLTPDQLKSFIPKFNRIDEIKRRYYNDRKRLVRKIRELIEDEEPSEGQLGALLQQLKSLDDKFHSDMERAYGELNSDLTVTQRAKLVLFLENYKRDLRRILMQLREIAESRGR
ncbi:TPA: hypothetical protein EYP37_10285 [Candidatus Poribacteria bacterium]|nr:hypothetical protein [Candidatus Poribacteria bacterium]